MADPPMADEHCFDERELVDFASGLILDDTRLEQISTHVESCDRCLEIVVANSLNDPELVTKGVSSFVKADVSQFDEEFECQRLVSTLRNSEKRLEIQVDEVIDGCRLVKSIRRTGISQVFLATHLDSGQLRVMKFRSTDRAQSDRVDSLFLRENMALFRLDHPAIVRAYEAGVYQGAPFISMEYVDGTTLGRRIELTGAVNVADAAAIALVILDAIDHIHQRGLTHNDLSPSNIMLREDGRITLLDLGMASSLDPRFMNLTQGGTPGFMPPEQRSGDSPSCVASDYYGLGALVYCMLTGGLPDGGANPTTIDLADQSATNNFADKDGFHSIHWPNKVPIPVRRLVDRLMRKEPGFRLVDRVEIERILKPYARHSKQFSVSKSLSDGRTSKAKQRYFAYGVLGTLSIVLAILVPRQWVEPKSLVEPSRVPLRLNPGTLAIPNSASNSNHVDLILGVADIPSQLLGVIPDFSPKDVVEYPLRQVDTITPRRFCTHFAPSPDGTKLATWGHDPSFRIFSRDVKTQTELNPLGLSIDAIIPFSDRHTSSASQSIAWHPSGKLVAFSSARDSIGLYDCDSRLLRELKLPSLQEVRDICWNSSGDVLATVDRLGTVYLWSAESGFIKLTDNQAREAGVIAWCPNHPSVLATIDGDGYVEVWEVFSGELIFERGNDYGQFCSVTWNQSNNRLYAVAGGSKVYSWDLNDNSEQILTTGLTECRSLLWDPTGTYLTVTGDGIEIFKPIESSLPLLHDSIPYRCYAWLRNIGLITLFDDELLSWQLDGELTTLYRVPSSPWASAIDWARSESDQIAIGLSNGELRVIDPSASDISIRRMLYEGLAINRIRWHPNGRWLAATFSKSERFRSFDSTFAKGSDSPTFFALVDIQEALDDSTSFEPVTIELSSSPISFDWRDDGRALAIVDQAGLLSVYSVDTESNLTEQTIGLRQQVSSGTSSPSALVWTSSNQTIYLGSSDGLLIPWEIDNNLTNVNPQPTFNLRTGGSEINSLAVSDDLHWMAASAANRITVLVDLTSMRVVHSISSPFSPGSLRFLPNSSLVAVPNYGIIDATDMQNKFDLGGKIDTIFSTDAKKMISTDVFGGIDCWQRGDETIPIWYAAITPFGMVVIDSATDIVYSEENAVGGMRRILVEPDGRIYLEALQEVD